MPPCAQTLCERFTGTRLIRSTSIPCSAIFIVAARPASPPPTTSTRCFAIIGPLSVVLVRCFDHNRQTDDGPLTVFDYLLAFESDAVAGSEISPLPASRI